MAIKKQDQYIRAFLVLEDWVENYTLNNWAWPYAKGQLTRELNKVDILEKYINTLWARVDLKLRSRMSLVKRAELVRSVFEVVMAE